MKRSPLFSSFILVLMSNFVSGYAALAANELPQTFTLDGQLSLSGSTDPLLDANAKIVVQILDPSKNCLLYEEQQIVSTTATNGYFNIQVGSNVGAAKRTGNDPGLYLPQIYQNTVAMGATSAPGKTCAGSTYTPTASDSRYLRLIVTPSSTNVADTLSPDTIMDSVPSALVAQTVQGYSPSQFLILGPGDLTQANLQTVFATGNAAKLNSLLSIPPANYMTKDSASGLVQLPTGTGTPTGVAAGQMWYDGGLLKYYDGSSVQSLGVAGGGLASLNGLVAGTQTFATGTSGTAPAYSSATSTHTLNIPMASTAAVTAGLLSKADYDTFNSKLSAVSNTATLAPTKIWIGDAGSKAQEFALSGDATMTSGGLVTVNKTTTAQANKLLSLDGSGVAASKGVQLNGVTSGSLTLQPAAVTTNYSLTFPAAQGAAGQALSNNGSGVLSWASTLTNALTSGKILVGNASNVSAEVSLSGDATMDNAGVVTLKNTGTAGTYGSASLVPIVTTDAQGRVTSVTTAAPSDATKLPLAGGTMTGAIAMGGQNMTNTGNITMAASKTFGLSSNAADPGSPAAGQVWYNSTSNVIKYYDGSTVQSLGVAGVGITSLNGLTAGTQTFAIGTSGTAPAFSSATSTHTLNIPMASTASVTAGLISKTDYDTFNAKLGAVSNTATLTAGKVWVGNASNSAVEQTLSGDISSVSNTGSVTIDKTQSAAASKILQLTASSVAVTKGTDVGGAGAGVAHILYPNTATDTTLTLPSSAGSANQFLQTDGAGILSWATPTPVLPGLASTQVWVGNASGTAEAVSLSGDISSITNAGVVTANKTTTAQANKLLSLDGSGVAASMGSQLNGVTSGSLTLQPAAVTTNYSLTFPAAQGTAGQTLSNNGSGVLSWVTPFSASTGFANGGNSFGADASLGTSDNYNLDIKTNNTSRMTILGSGNVGIGTSSPSSVLSTSAGDNTTVTTPYYSWPTNATRYVNNQYNGTSITAASGATMANLDQVTLSPSAALSQVIYGRETSVQIPPSATYNNSSSTIAITGTARDYGSVGTGGYLYGGNFGALFAGAATRNNLYGIASSANIPNYNSTNQASIVTSLYGGSFNANNTSTGGSVTSAAYGISVGSNNNGTMANQYGVNASATNASTGTMTGSQYGINVAVNHSGTGALANQYGANFNIGNYSSGSIGTVYGVSSTIYNNNATGTITNAYGLYLNKVNAGTITNNYGIYQADTSNNYLGGRLETGGSIKGPIISSVFVDANAADDSKDGLSASTPKKTLGAAFNLASSLSSSYINISVANTSSGNRVAIGIANSALYGKNVRVYGSLTSTDVFINWDQPVQVSNTSLGWNLDGWASGADIELNTANMFIAMNGYFHFNLGGYWKGILIFNQNNSSLISCNYNSNQIDAYIGMDWAASMTAASGVTGSRILNTQGTTYSAPSVRFYQNGTFDSANIDTSGVQFIRNISTTASGNVGIGSTAPLSKLSIGSTYSTAVDGLLGSIIYMDNGGTTDGSVVIKSHPGANGIIGGLKFAASPDATNYSWAGIRALTDSNAAAAHLAFYTATGNSDGATSIERMRIDGSGNVGIGTTTPAHKLDVNGDINIAAANSLRINGTSVCTSAGCTSSSDERLKENIEPLDTSLEKVLQLRGVEYDYKDKARFGNGHQIGVIAQEVERVYPEVVKTDSKTGFKAVAYDHLVAPLIEAVKTLYHRLIEVESHQDEQDREIASVKAENEKLKEENAEIKARLERIEKSLQSK